MLGLCVAVEARFKEVHVIVKSVACGADVEGAGVQCRGGEVGGTKEGVLVGGEMCPEAGKAFTVSVVRGGLVCMIQRGSTQFPATGGVGAFVGGWKGGGWGWWRSRGRSRVFVCEVSIEVALGEVDVAWAVAERAGEE